MGWCCVRPHGACALACASDYDLASEVCRLCPLAVAVVRVRWCRLACRPSVAGLLVVCSGSLVLLVLGSLCCASVSLVFFCFLFVSVCLLVSSALLPSFCFFSLL